MIDRQLSAVVFVQDYLQLQFDGSTLTLYVWPSVELSEFRADFAKAGYRDLLCNQIGKTIGKVLDDGEKISLHFHEGAVVTVALKNGDLPEAAMFHDQSGNCRVWR